MCDLLVVHGHVVTMDGDRRVLADGAVAVRDGEILAVGDTATLRPRYDPDTVIDAQGMAVIPGFVNAHTHVLDVLFRGVGTDRDLYDWLFNVDKPAAAVMDGEDHEVAAAAYCTEALKAGVTTFVENGPGLAPETVRRKMDVYDRAGIRSVYGCGLVNRIPGERRALVAAVRRTEPDVFRDGDATADPDPETLTTDPHDRLAEIKGLMEEYGDQPGRSIWVAPTVARGCTPAALRAALDLAERHGVMATTHTAEAPFEERKRRSSVAYLNDAGYLGERTLLGHCVHVTKRDLRVLAATDTRVAHNPLTNLALGSGIAPLPAMLTRGLTVGLGTDNTSASNTVNPLRDVRYLAMLHKATTGDAAVVTAERALELATIDAARAIGRGAELGSLEPGKRADVALIDLEYPHLTPRRNVPATLVYRARGFEVDTVVCRGEVVLENGRTTGLDGSEKERLERTTRVGRRVVDRAGLDTLS
jgi:cytosine/adenosine deaminase-related metal-dependent hydrolase